MPTTIQISNDVKKTLDRMKLMDRETYNEVIERMIEDNLELSKKARKEIEEAVKRIESGKFLTQKQVEKKLGL
ncbi:MAG: hypothetical protein ABIH63_02165 [archaeon]